MAVALPIELRRAFPSHLAPDALVVLSRLPSAELAPSKHAIGPVQIDGERVHIPARIYVPEPEASGLSTLTDTQRDMLACLYTRHHDGFVRQRHLRRVLPCAHLWAVPFVVQLIGEYVLEIHQDIEASLGRIDRETVGEFVRQNRPFLELTRQRVASYWDCYFRGIAPRKQDHVARRVLEWMEAAAERDA